MGGSRTEKTIDEICRLVDGKYQGGALSKPPAFDSVPQLPDKPPLLVKGSSYRSGGGSYILRAAGTFGG